jgi:hypothetical protein
LVTLFLGVGEVCVRVKVEYLVKLAETLDEEHAR